MSLRNLLFSVIGALALCLMCISGALAQGHTIRGKVQDSSGVHMAHVTVSLESGTGAMVNQTVTNNEGDFFFGGLGDTSYVITISAPDYNPASEHVDFVRTASANDPGETRTVEITLIGKSSRSPRAGLKFVQNVPQAALDLFEQATKSLSSGRAQEAQTALEAAIKLFPDYFDARFILAGELTKQGKLDEAIKQLNEAQRINPRDDRVWYAFGVALQQQGKYAVAARVFAQAAELNPGEPQHALVAQATALIDQAAMIDPAKSKTNSAERTFALATAEQALARAEQLSGKKLPEVHLQRARLFEKRGDLAGAASELEKYLRQVPDARNAAAIRDAIKRLRESTKQGGGKTTP
jgi:tetratricopeptide (TPR) repeat protein